MAETGLKLFGLAEVEAGLARFGGMASGSLMVGILEEEAAAVAASSKEKIAVYSGSSLGTIRPSVRARPTGIRAAVYQNKRKVTGNHPQFGRLQLEKMRQALDERTNSTVKALDDGLGKIIRLAGF